MPESEFRDHLLSPRHLIGEGLGARPIQSIYVGDLTAAECQDLLDQTALVELPACARYGELGEMRRLVGALVADGRLAPTAVIAAWLAREAP